MFVVCFMKLYSDFSSTGVISIISDDTGCGYGYILCPESVLSVSSVALSSISDRIIPTYLLCKDKYNDII